jgi:hypothetical protein
VPGNLLTCAASAEKRGMDSTTRVVFAVGVFITIVSVPVAYGSPSDGFEVSAIGGDKFRVKSRIQVGKPLLYQFHDCDNVFADELNDEWDYPGLFDFNQSLYAFFPQVSVVMARPQAKRDESLNPRSIRATQHMTFAVVDTVGYVNCLSSHPNLETCCGWMPLTIGKLR